jgi:predicted Zn finger-like uncharacterized protein
MAQSIRLECPHCSTKLNVKNPAVVGKKVRCPKCAEPFVAEVPPPAGEDEFLDNLGSLGDDFGETLPSARASAAIDDLEFQLDNKSFCIRQRREGVS